MTADPAPPHPSSASSRETARLAVLLAWVAGGVDAIGYLTLAHIFTAHMSGNSVAFGSALGQARWDTVVERGVPIALFAVGIVAGTMVGEASDARGARHPAVPVFAFEVALLVVFGALGSGLLQNDAISTDAAWQFYGLVALLTLAMGLQSATLRRVGSHSAHTTYVSGILTSLAEAVAQAVYRRVGARMARTRPCPASGLREHLGRLSRRRDPRRGAASTGRTGGARAADHGAGGRHRPRPAPPPRAGADEAGLSAGWRPPSAAGAAWGDGSDRMGRQFPLALYAPGRGWGGGLARPTRHPIPGSPASATRRGAHAAHGRRRASLRPRDLCCPGSQCRRGRRRGRCARRGRPAGPHLARTDTRAALRRVDSDGPRMRQRAAARSAGACRGGPDGRR